MIKKMYVVYDNEAKECGPIFEAKNDAVAMRNFRNLVEKSNISPDIFGLFCVGLIDTESGFVSGSFDLEKHGRTYFTSENKITFGDVEDEHN